MLQISKPSCSPEHGLNASAMMLVESHIPFARRAASKAARRSGVSFDDMFSAACLGLTDAAPTFDPDRGFAFATYALRPVMNRLRDECRMASSIVKRPRPTRVDPDPSEPKPSLSAIKFTGGYKPAIVDTALDAFESDTIDHLIGTSENPETVAADRQQTDRRGAILAAAIATLKPREQEIIAARHGDDEPATLGDLAARFGISAERVRQIESAALAKIKRTVRAAAGVRPAFRTGYDRQIAAMCPAKEATDNILRHSVIGSFGMDQSPEPAAFIAKMRMAAQ